MFLVGFRTSKYHLQSSHRFISRAILGSPFHLAVSDSNGCSRDRKRDKEPATLLTNSTAFPLTPPARHGYGLTTRPTPLFTHASPRVAVQSQAVVEDSCNKSASMERSQSRTEGIPTLAALACIESQKAIYSPILYA